MQKLRNHFHFLIYFETRDDLEEGERHGRENKCENISRRRHFDVLCLGECKFPLEVKVCIDYCVKCSPVRPERSCMSNFATEQYRVIQCDSLTVGLCQGFNLFNSHCNNSFKRHILLK